MSAATTPTSTSSSSSASGMLIQQLFIQFHSRKLLLHSPLLESPVTSTPPGTSPSEPVDNSFDANVVMVLSVLLCALICSLGLNSIIRCALRCSSLVSSGHESDPNPSARLTNTGIKKKALKKFLTISYTTELKLPGLHAECPICLSEFAPGEKVRVLPKCEHGFHARCIDKWLNSHSSCPTCRHCLIETCQKFEGCAAAAQSQNHHHQPPPPPPQQEASSTAAMPLAQESIVRIAPLEPEGFVRNLEA